MKGSTNAKMQDDALHSQAQTSSTDLETECPTEPDTTIDAPDYDELTEGFDPEKLGGN